MKTLLEMNAGGDYIVEAWGNYLVVRDNWSDKYSVRFKKPNGQIGFVSGGSTLKNASGSAYNNNRIDPNGYLLDPI